MDSVNLWIILFGALATYLTRIGGYLVISRVRALPPRIQAALDAVPAAVLTTIVAPAAVSHGLAEILAIIIAGLVALRSSLPVMFLTGACAIVLLRATGL